MALSLVPDLPGADDAPEVRVDPLSGLRVVVLPGAAELPPVTPAAPLDPADDDLAPGHEDRLGAELERVDAPSGGWAARAVEALRPAWVADPPEPEPDSHRDLFAASAAPGAHELIVHAPRPVTSLAELEADELALAVGLWRARMRAHAPAAALHLHVDERTGGGLPHSHAKLHALTFVPARLARERERFGAHATRTMGSDLLGDVVQEEVRRRKRLVAYDDEAVLLAPWASAVPYQLMVAPRRAAARFEDPAEGGAALLHQALRRLAARFGAPPPLSLWVRTAPRGTDRYTWRIDVHPRLLPVDGLELGAGVPVNPVAPERAAAELKAAL